MSMVLRLVFPSGPPDARWVSGFALAQVAALLTATSAIASTALVNRGANLPAWQSFFVYALLAVFYVPAHALGYMLALLTRELRRSYSTLKGI